MKKAFQWDLARQMERPEFLLKQLPHYAEWGYEEVYLYLEDAFDYPSAPGVGRRFALTPKQMEALVAEAERRGMQVVPVVPLLGHTAYLLKMKRLLELSEKRDSSEHPLAGGQLCPLHAGTGDLARKLMRDVSSYCTAGLFHAGLDESFEIAQCPRCRAEVKKIGLGRHFANYVKRLHEIAASMGLRLGMWGDMLYGLPEAIPLLPKDVVVYDWFYYPFKEFPRVELYNFAEVDSTGTLRKAGLAVYGCPMNSPFAHEPLPPFLDRLRNIISWWRYLKRKGGHGMLITSWSSARAPIELNMVVDAAAASLWLDGEENPRKMLEHGWQRAFGRRDVAALSAAAEKYQYCGYYRWQSSKGWQSLANLDSLEPLKREEVWFRRLTVQMRAGKRRRRGTRKKNAPVSLRYGLEFRHFLARRDLFIRHGARMLFQARRWVRTGKDQKARTEVKKLLRAAQEMRMEMKRGLRATHSIWRRSRYASEPNPNACVLEEDCKRLAALEDFLRRCLKNLRHLWKSNPLTGRWHLLFRVRNFAPALQGTVVEMPGSNGEWKTVHNLWSLEFSANAGRPKADFRRCHSVPLDWDGKSSMKLRLGVRGLGRLEFYDMRLTNGVEIRFPLKMTKKQGTVQRLGGLRRHAPPGAVMGVRPPRKGFHFPDGSSTRATVELIF